MEYITTMPQVLGLPQAEQNMLNNLWNEYVRRRQNNLTKEKYYDGKISINDVNLGIAIPKMFKGFEVGCAWGAKAVDVLAARSMFDGFVDETGVESEELAKLVADNNMLAEYAKTCRDELKIGCSFATLSSDDAIGCKIRFHSANTACAHWNGDKGRLDYGFAVIDATNTSGFWEPTVINLYTDDAIWVLINKANVWQASYYPHRMGRPLMEALTWNATSAKPFGRSRLKEPVRRLIDGYVRTVANATLGLEFSTAPQKYLLGVTDEQYDAVVNQKFKQYIGSIIAATFNPDTGEKPTFGQLQQGNISPHVEMMRLLSTQFSAATGLTVTDTGVINDANPTSSDAILAQSQTLVRMAEELNAVNGNALRNIALMALAIIDQTTIEDLDESKKSIVAHFKNPAMPSVAVTADAAIKIASARQSFAQTDAFLEMIGFSQADIRRIRSQERMAAGMQMLTALEE